MKVPAKITGLLVTAIIVASILTCCAMQQKVDTKPSKTISPKTVGQDISGEWQVIDSTARFKISFVDGDIHIEGWDSSDGERFRISDVQWDGKRLKGIFVMPSTNNTTYSDLLLTGANTLKGTYKGNSSGEEVWKRQ